MDVIGFPLFSASSNLHRRKRWGGGGEGGGGGGREKREERREKREEGVATERNKHDSGSGMPARAGVTAHKGAEQK